MLDWFGDDHDLWRHVEQLETWHRNPPPWRGESADKRPSGWRYPVRNWTDAETLGGVAVAALDRTHAQQGTPPVLDLAPVYGARTDPVSSPGDLSICRGKWPTAAG